MEKLIAIIGLVRVIYGKWLFRQLLTRASVIAVFALIALMLVFILLAGGCYTAYYTLLHTGIEPYQALMLVETSILILTLVFIFLALFYLRRLQTLPKRLLQKKIPAVSQASEIIDAFLDGFLTPEERK